MKKKLPGRPGGDRTIVRIFRIKDYDAVFALWRRSEGVGLNESDTRAAIASFLRRNPRHSFIAEKQGRIIGAVLCGHDGRRGYLHHLAVASGFVNRASAGNWWMPVRRNFARRVFKNAISSSSPIMHRAGNFGPTTVGNCGRNCG